MNGNDSNGCQQQRQVFACSFLCAFYRLVQCRLNHEIYRHLLQLFTEKKFDISLILFRDKLNDTSSLLCKFKRCLLLFIVHEE